MSKADVWMPLHIADYLADTMHLNAQQHGAYMLLLMHHWRAGHVPLDESQLASIARCDWAVWKRSVWPVIKLFFSEQDGKLIQKRAVAEREYAESLTDKRSKAGKDGAEKRWGKDGKKKPNKGGGDGNGDSNLDGKAIAKPLAKVSQASSQTDAPSPSPIPVSSLRSETPPNPQTVPVWPGAAEFNIDPEDEPPPKPPGRRGECAGDPDFERFWAGFPRKVGKGQARRAWQAAIRKAEPDAIIAAMLAQRFDPRERFQPHPTTWLNGERWLDQQQTGDPVLRAAGLLDPENFEPDPRWARLQ
ncbi:MAG: YdaU family protein [Pseudomonadota bacterium]|nr:YdaU family protein [Pseudomonadota bacterium]